MSTRFDDEHAIKGTCFLKIATLKVDDRVQRPLDRVRAHNMAMEFNPDGFGIIHVSRRTNGDHFIIDGQHRVAAAKEFLGDSVNGQLIECKVYERLSLREEAERFRLLNSEVGPGRIQKFLISIEERHPETLAIVKILNEFGLRVAYYAHDQCVPAVGALQAVYRGLATKNAKHQQRPELLTSTLAVLTTAWGGVAGSLNGELIEGIGRLLEMRGDKIDLKDLAKRLSSYPGGGPGVIGKARGRRDIMGGRLANNVAEVALEIYNRGRRVNTVEALR